jgi:cellulose biosynthesis protein BcsQ
MLVRPNLWLLPANIHLVGAESELVSVVARETILREALLKCEDSFDYLIIDCPPSLGLLTLNALAATEEILIPLQPHFLALQGFGKLLQTVELVGKRINPNLKVTGVLLCMFDSRASLPNEVKADIQQFLDAARDTNCAWAEAQILPVHIRRNIKLVAEFIHNQNQPIPPVEIQPSVEADSEDQYIEDRSSTEASVISAEESVHIPIQTEQAMPTTNPLEPKPIEQNAPDSEVILPEESIDAPGQREQVIPTTESFDPDPTEQNTPEPDHGISYGL